MLQDAQAQTGYRYTYIYSAWRETLEMSAQNVAVRAAARARARARRRRPTQARRFGVLTPPASSPLAPFRLPIYCAQAFWGFCTQWVPGTLRHIRTARFPAGHAPWDVHPFNYALAVAVYFVGWVASGLLLLAIVALKALPILLRAVSNHIYVFNVWAPLPWKKGFKCVSA